jgi:DNA-binding MarR family transcriptional regulator
MLKAPESELSSPKPDRVDPCKDDKVAELLASEIFKVIPSIMQTIRQEMRSNVNGVTIPQFRILARLESGPTNHRDLADWIGVSHPAISRMVSMLEDRNLVARDRQRKDRRFVHLSLTPQGSEFFKKCKLMGQKSLAKRFSVMSSAQKQAMIQALGTLELALMNPEDKNEKANRTNSSTRHVGLRPRTNQ